MSNTRNETAEDDMSNLDAELESLSCDITLDSFDIDASSTHADKEESNQGTSELENQLKKLDTLHEIEQTEEEEKARDTRSTDKDTLSQGKKLPSEDRVVDNLNVDIGNDLQDDDDSISVLSTRTDASRATQQSEALTDILSKLIEETEVDDVRKWSNRVDNTKCYELGYRPVPRESKEIENLAQRYLSSGRNAPRDLHPYLMPTKDDHKSVLLKREPIIFAKLSQDESDERSLLGRHQSSAKVGHLILLNRCFFIVRDRSVPAARSNANQGGKKHKNLIGGIGRNISKGLLKSVDTIRGRETKFECCHPLASITEIYQTNSDSDSSEPELQLLPSLIVGAQCADSITKYQIYCHSIDRMRAWLYAFSVGVERSHTIERESILAKMSEERLHKASTPNENVGGGDEGDQSSERESVMAKMKRAGQEKVSILPSMNMDGIMSNFQERGERLEEIEGKSKQLEDQAANYRELTKQLREKLEKKNKNWFGI